jgi:hypothetical protein
MQSRELLRTGQIFLLLLLFTPVVFSVYLLHDRVTIMTQWQPIDATIDSCIRHSESSRRAASGGWIPQAQLSDGRLINGEFSVKFEGLCRMQLTDRGTVFRHADKYQLHTALEFYFLPLLMLIIAAIIVYGILNKYVKHTDSVNEARVAPFHSDST